MARRHLLMLLVLSAFWGASFMLIKIGIRGFAPTTLICLRFVLAVLGILPVALARVGGARLARELRAGGWPLFALGLFNCALPIVGLAWAERRIDSGLGAVIQASSPLFTALLALRYSRGDRVRGGRLAGLLVGFVGVAVLVGAQPHGDLLAALTVVGSAIGYAIGAIVAGTRLGALSPWATAVGSLGWGALILLPAAVFQFPEHAPGWKPVAALVALALGGTAVAYVLYYAIIGGAGASYGILVTYLTPGIALLYGAAFLGEGVSASDVGGLALILGGVALGTGALRLKRRRVATLGP